MEAFDPKGFVWHDPHSRCLLKLLTEGPWRGWVCYQHSEGHWVSARESTPEDYHNAFEAMIGNTELKGDCFMDSTQGNTETDKPIHGATSGEDNIRCPYCGHEHRDSWEFGLGEDDGEDECVECERSFKWSRQVTVTYSTQPVKKGD